MTWLWLVIALLAVGALVLAQARSKQRAELSRQAELEPVRKVAEEDVTRFGEELQELHIDTLTTTLDTAMRQDYQRALDAYENAKLLLRDVQTPQDVSQVTKTLEDGRYAQACVLARQDGRALPQRRPPCFFNPAHGPSETDVEWSPAGGLPREIPVCLADADRVRAGAEPDSRMVRKDNQMVPWYQGGRRYSPYADGYYGNFALNGLFPAFLIGSMMSGMWAPSVTAPPEGESGGDVSGDGGGDAGGAGGGEDWSGGADGGGSDGGDAGGDLSGGGDVGGGDYGGGDFSGGDGGGFDGGGFDGGGFDFGGF